MVTDIVAFSTMVQQIGDERSRHLMRRHNTILRTCIRVFGGREVDHTGDGIFAAFTRGEQALDCACIAQRALARWRQGGMGMHVRIGLHAGKPLVEEDRLFGHDVNTTFRICTAGMKDEVVLAESILGACSHTEWNFIGPQRAALKGIRDNFDLYTACWHEQPPSRCAEAMRVVDRELKATTVQVRR